MDAFFPTYCCVCDKTLHDFSDLYCSDACRLHDSSPRLKRNLASKQRPLMLQYPSVLLQQHTAHHRGGLHARDDTVPMDVHAIEHDHENLKLHHSHSHNCHIHMEPVSPPSVAPELSVSDDDDMSVYSVTDIPALSLDSRGPLSL